MTNWKNGKNPNMEEIKKISEFFNVSTDYIIKGENPTTQTIINSQNHISGGIQANTYHSENVQPKDKIQEELLKILSELTVEEQIKLMNLVYNFRENLNEKKTKIICELVK